MKKFLITSGKKIVTYISVFSLLATAVMAGFTGIDFGVKATGGVWAGSGTAADPYEVADEADLREVVKCGGVDQNGNKLYFELVDDIALNDTTNWSSVGYDSGYTKWEFANGDNLATTSSPVFRGDLQGNGHTISGLFATGNNGISGLFPLATGGANVSNLKIDKAYLNVNGYAGIVFGRVIPGGSGDVNISYVSVTDSFVKSYYGNGGAGIVGAAHHGSTISISGCSYVKGTMGGVEAVFPGAMIGDAWSCSVSISNCWSSGFPLVKKAFQSYSISNCYTDVAPGVTLSGNLGVVSSMKGATAATCPNLDSKVIWEFVENDYPKLRNVLESVNGTEGEIWSGATAKKFAGGTGTKLDPYIIKTGEQLHKMIADKEKGAYYELGADIYLNDVSTDTWHESALPWATAGTYTGIDSAWELHLEGNGHKISGLYVNVSGQSTTSALIPISGSNTSITNVHIVDSYIKGQVGAYENYAVGFIGFVAEGSTGVVIGGCTIDDSVKFGGGQKGSGFVGGMNLHGSVLIYNCGFAGQLDPAQYNAKCGAGFLADSWTQGGGLTVYNSYCYGAPAVAKANGNSKSTKLYTTVSQEDTQATAFPVTVIDGELMKGEAAKANMAFDWTVWQTVADDFPIPYFDINGLDGTPGRVWSGLCADNYEPYTADYAYPAGYTLEDPSNPLSKIVDSTGAYFYGDGTDAYPYHIATGEQLYKLVSQNSNDQGVGVRYDLIADIYLNDVQSESWANKTDLNQWCQGSQFAAFRGHFNGNGHIVVGLAYDVVSHNSTLALFPCLGESGIIENVGVVNAYINDNSYTAGHTQFAAAVVGYIASYGDPGTTTTKLPLDELEALGFTPPVIRKCFADADTLIRGKYAGGIVCGMPSPARIEDCYFLGTLRGDLTGGIVGDAWPQNCANCYRCYSVPTDNDRFASGNWGSSGIKYGCYSFERSMTGGGVNYLYVSLMRGDLAKQNMPELFEDGGQTWMTVEGGSPVLKVFGERAIQFSDTKYRPTVIEFATNTEECEFEAMSGAYGDPITLPIPTRQGYDFGGWYYYKELQCEANFTTFPMIGVTLYAKWIKNSVTQDFENYPDTKYDRDPNGDYEIYRPGSAGYTAALVNGGSKSLHRIGNTTTAEDILLNYEETLVKNTIYEVTFWVTTDEEGTEATVSLVRNTWPDIDIANEPITGVEEMAKIQGLVPGEWTQYTYKFTADTEWVSLRTTGDASLFFDDFNFVPVGTVDAKTEQAGGENIPTSTPVDTAPLSPATADNTVSLVALMSAFAAAAVVLLFSGKHLTEVIDN